MIPDFEMHPIELHMLITEFQGMLLSPNALRGQWIELTDEPAWLLRCAFASEKGRILASYKMLRFGIAP